MKDVRRGYLPEYENDFKGNMDNLFQALYEVQFLLNRGYKIKPATVFVADRHQMTEHQRLVLARCCAKESDIKSRMNKTTLDIKGKEVYVDGFNAIIPMESLLSHSPLFIAMDTAVRDLANLRGNYHIIMKTEPAIKLILDKLEELSVSKVNIHLDKPVSNSGRLKTLIAEVYEKNKYSFDLDIQLFDACDKSLYNKDYVVSGDCIVMDNAKHIVPLYKEIIDDFADAWLIDTRNYEEKGSI